MAHGLAYALVALQTSLNSSQRRKIQLVAPWHAEKRLKGFSAESLFKQLLIDLHFPQTARQTV